MTPTQHGIHPKYKPAREGKDWASRCLCGQLFTAESQEAVYRKVQQHIGGKKAASNRAEGGHGQNR